MLIISGKSEKQTLEQKDIVPKRYIMAKFLIEMTEKVIIIRLRMRV